MHRFSYELIRCCFVLHKNSGNSFIHMVETYDKKLHFSMQESRNSLFGDLFKEFGSGILGGGVPDCLDSKFFRCPYRAV